MAALTLTADDRIAIEELMARYNVAFDSCDVQAWVDTFLPDGVFDGIYAVTVGAEALGEFLRWHWSDPKLAAHRGSQHWVTNVVIEGNETEARVQCYGTVLSGGRSGNRVMGVWQYHDEVRKVDGKWRYAKRYVRAFEPAAEGTEHT